MFVISKLWYDSKLSFLHKDQLFQYVYNQFIHSYVKIFWNVVIINFNTLYFCIVNNLTYFFLLFLSNIPTGSNNIVYWMLLLGMLKMSIFNEKVIS
jgi:hypothetical protein